MKVLFVGMKSFRIYSIYIYIEMIDDELISLSVSSIMEKKSEIEIL
jgi:hypothetical protein